MSCVAHDWQAPESLLEHDGMRLALAGSSSELGVQTLLWPDLEKGSSDLAEGSSTSVEVEFGQVTLSALAAPPVGGFSLFADLVEQMGSNEVWHLYRYFNNTSGHWLSPYGTLGQANGTIQSYAGNAGIQANGDGRCADIPVPGACRGSGRGERRAASSQRTELPASNVG